VKTELDSIAQELAIWKDEGRWLPFWWRDDDATMPTPDLDRLLTLADRHGAPLHLAVTPKPASRELAARLLDAPNAWVLPHGWRHVNHAPAGHKKAEFCAERPLDVMLGEVAEGWRRIQDLFGTRALPVFVPPWNRIAPALLPALPSAGIFAISTFKARKSRYPAPGLFQVNTHVDPFDWRLGGMHDLSTFTTRIAALLSARRLGPEGCNDEPFGLLTHHLAHDETVWTFVGAFLETVLQSGAARWASPLVEVAA
jgi:hypothetical protein